MNETTVDIFADDQKPKIELGDIIVKISVPNWPNGNAYAILTIERESRYIANFDWYWFGIRNPRRYNSENWHLLDTRKLVYEWLTEWELIELRAIGPEDAEYFATEQLMEQVNLNG